MTTSVLWQARVGASRAIFCRECQRQVAAATSSGNRFEDTYIEEMLAELQANIDDADAQVCHQLQDGDGLEW